MKVCVFLGPTLPAEDAERLLPGAVVLPPVRHGDIVRAMDDHAPDVLAVIDGFFEQTPAVWHKEILWALSAGIRVHGAASMGALRAAELEPFGMKGAGRIFEAYKTGSFAPFEDTPFEDDDEVAVSHGPAEIGYPGSVALTDIRATLAAACESKVIDPALRDRLAALAKGIFYKDRRYDELLSRARSAGAGAAALDRLEGWLPEGAVQQKRLDAEELLTMLRTVNAAPFEPRFHFEHTTVWEAALQSLERPAQE